LSDKELEERFYKVLSFLDVYTRTYFKTEEARFEKINEKDNDKIIKELGEDRFRLRKEGENIFYIILGVFLKEIYKRTGARVSDMYFYDMKEMKDLFDGKILDEDLMRERSKGYVLISLKDKQYILTGDEFKKLYLEVVKSRLKISQLKGAIASRGIVAGRVRLLIHNKRNVSKEAEKFKKGEILVTEMTRPGIIMACHKASAIITDEGGITCHAAIVARELGIPCIIGTKIATQVLKDGDLVEVDADKGIVKILK
jgi:phosphohistidine swiveling domain-containing protein